MRQFQGCLGPIQELQPKGRPGPLGPSKNGAQTAVSGEDCNPRAIDWQIVGLITALILSGAVQGIAVGLLLS